jgi:hypothetical protein
VNWINNLLRIGTILLAVVLGMRTFREFDLWIFIRTGEWIVENRSFIDEDVFSYTFKGEPWTHFKYGYSLIAYVLTELFGGPQYIYLLQVLFNLALVWVTQKFIRILNPNASIILISICTTLILFMLEFRMNSRPEWFTYLLSTLFLMIGYLGLQKSSKYFYLLIPLQIFWVNVHDAFVVGNVLTIVLLLFGLISRFKFHQILPVILTYSSTIINPYHWNSFLYPLNIFSQLGDNKYTPELSNFLSSMFWSNWQAYVFVCILSLLIISFIRRFKLIQLHHFFLYLATFSFAFLALKAQRNIPLFIISSLIILSSSLSRKFIFNKSKSFQILTLAIFVLLYFGVVSNFYYKITNSRIRYGFAINENYTPIKSAKFLGERLEMNEKGFVDYLSSAYYLYALSPSFESFIDLRDLDVFTHQHFSKYHSAITNPKSFEELNDIYHFKYVVLYTKDHHYLHFYLYNHSNWYCAYLDENSAIYLPRKADNLQMEVNLDGLEVEAIPLNKLFNWSYAKREALDPAEKSYLTAKYFQSVVDPENAIEFARRSASKNTLYESNILLSKLLFKQMRFDQNDKSKYFNEIGLTLENATILEPENPIAYLGLAELYRIKGERSVAFEYYTKAWGNGANLNLDSVMNSLSIK